MANTDLILIGAGGFGREVFWQISSFNPEAYNIIGFVDDDPALIGQQVNGLPILGNIEWMSHYPEEISAAICIGKPKARKEIYNKISKNSGLRFPTIVASDVRYSKFVKFGQGCIICLSTTMTVNIKLGDFVIVNPHCGIGHDACLDDFVTLYWNVNIAGKVHVNACAEIGTGTNIIQEKTIGENAIIGAGSVVVKDIPSNCTAVGTPAVPIKVL